MKRLFNILIILSLILPISPSLFGQLSGNGSSSTPYYGTFESDIQWNSTNFTNGKVFITGDVTIDDEELTIEAGMKIIFVTEGADLIVTGTGQLDASGSSGSEIIFTADDDDDGNYGETNERWGHIVFQSMDGSAGSSTFEYCDISYGDVSSGSNTTSYGGAIYIDDFDDLSFKNCSFSNNTGTHGGAVMLWDNSSPTIENCSFSENNATTSGGAIYLTSYCSSIISNCLFTNNSSGNGGGGAFFFEGSNSSILSNCTLANNTTSSTSRGYIFFYNINTTTRPIFKNCIIWGNDNSISYSSESTTNSQDFEYCGIQDTETSASSFTYCIDLNGTNSASDGPNFLDPILAGGTDWSIHFISPCRDIGTNTGAPIADYEGSGRIGTTDIGAYEVQYSRWDGSTSNFWGTSANWEQNIAPESGTSDIIIPAGLSNYPTAPFTDHTIGNGKYLILEAGAQTTFTGLTNNSGGTLELHSDASGIASLLFDAYYDSGGTEEINMYLTGGGAPNYKWHYITVPDDAVSVTPFTTDIGNYNLLLWDETKIVSDKMEGWQWYDGYEGTTAFSYLNTMEGYNFYYKADTTIVLPTMTGLRANLGSDVILDYTNDGLNLLGNSLTCSIDWDVVERTGNMRNAIYFTKDNTMVSYVNGVGTPSGTTGIIPPLQAFFVKALETGCDLDFTGAGVKTHGTVNRYKSGFATIPLVRLELSNVTQDSDETVIRFDDLATLEFDNDFDASKLFAGIATNSIIYSSLGEEIYSINGVPFPEEEIIIPLTIQIAEEGEFNLNLTEFQGLDNYHVELIDTYETFTTDLHSTSTYAFSSSEGIITDRFLLKVSSKTTGLDDMINDKLINIYAYNNYLYIRPDNNNWADPDTKIKVYDIMGRLVKNISDVSIYGGETKEIPFSQPNGVYIVELSGRAGRIVQKISKR